MPNIHAILDGYELFPTQRLPPDITDEERQAIGELVKMIHDGHAQFGPLAISLVVERLHLMLRSVMDRHAAKVQSEVQPILARRIYSKEIE